MTASLTREQIVENARKIIDGLEAPILLSLFGQMLSRECGASFRPILGSQPLREFLLEEFSDLIEFFGDGTSVSIGRKRESNGRSIQFNPRFWAAFSKPISDGDVRWIMPAEPFDFGHEQPAPSGAIVIDARLVPDASLPSKDRAKAIIASINTWCSANNLMPEKFRITDDLALRRRHQGIEALLALIDAVPASDRKNFSLPLDLIGRLLSSK